MNQSSNPTTDRSLLLIFLFAGTLFTSAALMFVLQPMFGKILLPLLGGSPAVWNTCMVFYQSILFLGYLYAHYLSTRLNQHKQILIHIAVILVSFLALPVALPDNVSPPTESNPTFWLLGVLFLSIGLPFFVVSTTAPLIQKWFANVGHHTSHDPYYLYAASNTGSLIALLSYPFLLEPNIGLANQKSYWSVGFLLLCLLIAACAFTVWKAQQAKDIIEEPIAEDDGLSIVTKLHWLALAFVPSSLLLGLTTFISTDIASVPLLWIIPLTLYLLTFVIVFSKWHDKVHSLMVTLQPMVLLPFIAYSFINPAVLPYWVDLGLHLTAFFLAVMVCHGELARLRPNTRHLTTYYLIMSFAGMLGGMFNTFVAPFIFNAVYEYPLMIIAALLLRPGLKASIGNTRIEWLKQLILPALLIIMGLGLFFSLDDLPQYLDTIGVGLILVAGLTYAFRVQPVTLALLTGILIFFTFGLHGLLSNTRFRYKISRHNILRKTILLYCAIAAGPTSYPPGRHPIKKYSIIFTHVSGSSCEQKRPVEKRTGRFRDEVTCKTCLNAIQGSLIRLHRRMVLLDGESIDDHQQRQQDGGEDQVGAGSRQELAHDGGRQGEFINPDI